MKNRKFFVFNKTHILRFTTLPDGVGFKWQKKLDYYPISNGGSPL
jgi:hypothetical protein